MLNGGVLQTVVIAVLNLRYLLRKGKSTLNAERNAPLHVTIHRWAHLVVECEK